MSIFVAKRTDRNGHPRAPPRADYRRGNPLTQLVNSQRGGVDHAIGPLAHLGQRHALAMNTLGDGGAARGHRMRTAALRVTAREYVVRGVEENYLGMNSGRVEFGKHMRPLRKEQTLTRIDSERDTLYRGIASGGKQRDTMRQRNWQVI